MRVVGKCSNCPALLTSKTRGRERGGYLDELAGKRAAETIDAPASLPESVEIEVASLLCASETNFFRRIQKKDANVVALDIVDHFVVGRNHAD